MNLVEVIFFAGLALFIIMGIYRFLRRSVRITETASQSIGLQVGARNLLENMVRDVNAAHVFIETKDNKLTLAKYRDHGAASMLKLNENEPGYPFYRPGGGVTQQQIPVTIVGFEYDPVRKVVWRRSRDADLCLQSENNYSELVKVVWPPKWVGIEYKKILARNVDIFKLRYFGYHKDTGRIISRSIGDPSGSLGTVAPWRNLAMVLVHFKAKYDFASEFIRDEQVEIMTKIWSYKMLADARYKPAFSSIDYDTRY